MRPRPTSRIRQGNAALIAVLAGALLAAAVPTAHADEDMITVRQITPELAREIAWNAIQSCRKHGYQVTVAVVDRAGILQVLMRDTLAAPYTIQIAQDKAHAVILSGVSSGEFVRNRSDIRVEMDHVKGIIMLRGGIPIRAAGMLVGAVGVAGAPGGDKDEACARAGLDAVRERLDFAQ